VRSCGGLSESLTVIWPPFAVLCYENVYFMSCFSLNLHFCILTPVIFLLLGICYRIFFLPKYTLSFPAILYNYTLCKNYHRLKDMPFVNRTRTVSRISKWFFRCKHKLYFNFFTKAAKYCKNRQHSYKEYLIRF
jgi:hypothetical protein